LLQIRSLLEQLLPGGHLPGLRHVLCASAGAITSAVVRVPSDVIKHRVQASMYPNIKAAATSILQKEGVRVGRGPWAMSQSPVVGRGLWVVPRGSWLVAGGSWVGGSRPGDTAQQPAQRARPPAPAPCSPRAQGLYSGFGATLMRDIPEIAIQFALYEHLKHAALGMAKGQLQVRMRAHCDPPRRHACRRARRCGHRSAARALLGWSSKRTLRLHQRPPLLPPKVDDEGDLHPSGHMLVGGASGALAASITMPLDTLKTRLQVASAAGPVPNVGKVLAGIVREQGIAGLYKGLGPKVLQTALMSAVFFSCFECCKAQMRAVSALQAQREAAGTLGSGRGAGGQAAGALGSGRAGSGRTGSGRREAPQEGLLKLALPLSGRGGRGAALAAASEMD
jgi:hypothetical protein